MANSKSAGAPSTADDRTSVEPALAKAMSALAAAQAAQDQIEREQGRNDAEAQIQATYNSAIAAIADQVKAAEEERAAAIEAVKAADAPGVAIQAAEQAETDADAELKNAEAESGKATAACADAANALAPLVQALGAATPARLENATKKLLDATAAAGQAAQTLAGAKAHEFAMQEGTTQAKKRHAEAIKAGAASRDLAAKQLSAATAVADAQLHLAKIQSEIDSATVRAQRDRELAQL